MLVLMSCTLLVAAPITIVGGLIMALREDGPLSLILAGQSDPETGGRMASSRERLRDALIAVIEPDAALLRRPPHAVAQMLLLVCGANTYGPFGDPDNFRGAELVSLLLDGFLIRDKEEDTRGAQ
jgi:hypothetical protein